MILLVPQPVNLQVLLVILVLYKQQLEIFFNKFALEEKLMVAIQHVSVILNSVDVVHVCVLVMLHYVVAEVLGIVNLVLVHVPEVGHKHLLDIPVLDVELPLVKMEVLSLVTQQLVYVDVIVQPILMEMYVKLVLSNVKEMLLLLTVLEVFVLALVLITLLHLDVPFVIQIIVHMVQVHQIVLVVIVLLIMMVLPVIIVFGFVPMVLKMQIAKVVIVILLGVVVTATIVKELVKMEVL